MSNQSKGRSGGVLSINAATTRKPAASQKSSQRTPAPRLRLIIRRLAPGLTEAEFWEAIGSEWQPGKGQIEWFAYKSGKVSRDPSKPSRPSRAYLKAKDQALLEALSAKVRTTQFKDSKGTSTDSCLIGPPSLEFAPYNKFPGGRMRNDGRQGTIDQDPEFIDFLQSLTEPTVKPAVNGVEASDTKPEKLTTTPLIQYIKEKKANKAKEKDAAVAAKTSKKIQDNKDAKNKSESRSTVVIKSNNGSTEKSRPVKAAQNSVKVINKPSTTTTQNKANAPKIEPKPKDPPAVSSPAPKRERERGNASAAARMISRDLGLIPKEPKIARTTEKTTNPSSTTSDTSTRKESAPKTSVPVVSAPVKPSASAAAAPAAAPTGPRNSRTASAQQQPKQSQAASQRQGKASAQPSAGAKSAFLKHANSSQGITEELLRTTFIDFGDMTRCEIDKKKGLGYIDFVDPDSLKKAMAASPVKIGNGQVVVLENKGSQKKPQHQKGEASAAAQARAGVGTNASNTKSPATNATSLAVNIIDDAAATTIAISETPDQLVSPPIPTPTSTSIPIPTPTHTSTPPAPGQPQVAAKAPRSGANNQRNARGGGNQGGGRAAGGNRGGRGGFKGRGRGGRGASTTGSPQNASTQPAASTAPPTATSGQQ